MYGSILLPAVAVILVTTSAIAEPKTPASQYLPIVVTEAGGKIVVDHKALVSRANLHLEDAIAGPESGLPIGNGRMGSLLWVDGKSLTAQVNRVDVFSTDSYGSSLFHRHEDYCGGCGTVRIRCGELNLAGSGNVRDLDLYTAVATIGSKRTTVTAFVCSDLDVMVVTLSGLPKSASVSIELSMLRPPVVKTRDHCATSRLVDREDRISLVQEFAEGQYFCTSAVSVKVIGGKAKATVVDEKTTSLDVVKREDGDLKVLVSSAATFDHTNDVLAKTYADLDDASRDAVLLRERNRAWWQEFWGKSFIHLHSQDGEAEFVETQYIRYLYDVASTSRGKFPPKFNGMLWTSEGDTRLWGSQYWWENTQPIYRALPAANHLELMRPLFNMYSGMFQACETAARQQWGSKGINLPETVFFNGPEVLPDSVAAELQDLLLERKAWIDISPEFKKFATTRHVHSSRWNWKDRDWLPYGTTTQIFSSGAKIAYLYWLRYQYTMDEQWLRSSAYPMIKGVAEFYRNYPKFGKGPDGRYHIRNVNNGEPVVGATDTIEELSAIRGMLLLAIAASERLGIDADLRPLWEEVVANLAPLPTSKHHDAIVANRSRKTVTFAEGLKPVHFMIVQPPIRTCQPCLHYDLWSLESDEPGLAILANASLSASEYHKALKEKNGPGGGMCETPAEAAKLGRSEDIRLTLPNECRPVGFLDYMRGPESYGAMSYALQLALVQSVPARPGGDPVIRVFPAWPKQWDASFMLLCRGGFLVSSAQQDGVVSSVTIKSQLGGTCRIRNPWTGSAVAAKFHSGRQREVTGELLIFETQVADEFNLFPKSPIPK